MMKIEIFDEEKTITGLSVQTSSKIEADPEAGTIPGLWQLFDNNVNFDFDNGSRVYGVYYNYEPDAAGEFTVLVGTDQSETQSMLKLETVVIPSGKYAVFHAKGEMPHTVIETWGEVWKYFSGESAQYKRTYTTDFEFYVDKNELKIYIAVK